MFDQYGREFFKKKSGGKNPQPALKRNNGKTEGREVLGGDQGPDTLAVFVRNS